MFESEYARCEYIEKDNVVFHTWKKEAHYDDYRDPVKASLELLRDHENSVFIVDARNGFEDVPEDVEWGFKWFLPELKKTGCKIWGFILPQVCGIEGEIDLWTKEIEKNFRVIRAESYEDIVKQIGVGVVIMEIKKLEYDLTVCKLQGVEDIDLSREFFFICKTDEEISLVCKTEDVPQNTLARDEGWRGFRIQGVLDFSLIGILSKISGILADNNISIFAVSTYNTDYILVKKESFDHAMEVLCSAGYSVI